MAVLWNTNKLESQTGELSHLLGRMANGDFSAAPSHGGSILDSLNPAILRLQDELCRQNDEKAAFGQALRDMIAQHAAGWIDERIDAHRFNGQFRDFATMVNDLVTAHIDVKMRVVNVVTRYGEGDFSVDMDRLPGKKAQITEAIDRVKASFMDIAAGKVQAERYLTALREVSHQHELGWIDEKIPEREFTGTYAESAKLVNDLVAAHIAVKMHVVDVVTRFAKGDFSVDMDRLPGKKAQITEAIDKAKQSFLQIAEDAKQGEKFLEALREMDRQHTAGWIDERIDVKALRGIYAEAAQIANDLVAAHIAVKMRVVDVVKAYARGDFSVDMDRLPGKKAQITEAIDGVKHSIEGLSREITMLVDAAVRGDFTVRGDETNYENAFRTMVEGLNTLMRTAETGLSEVARVLGALAKGDLTEQITNAYEGTFGQLKDDSNLTVQSLTTLVKQIKESVDLVNDAAREIAAGNNDLSQRTEEQASSLEETASSMEELTSTVRQNTDNAKQANQLAIGARDIAERGGKVVDSVVATMASINESAKKIVDIISVIDGIAFQTNILALNAAVEAARAGEQGRGFAVVAGEVRNLAQRSAAAAKEIKSLINDSVEKTDAGSRLVDTAGKTMEEIVTAVKRVTDIMSEIAAASNEQGAGIEQVNTAISQMERVVQQNAALVEEAAAAAAALEEQANVLVGAVSVFRMSDLAGFGQAAQAKAAAPAPKRALAAAVHAVAVPKATRKRRTELHTAAANGSAKPGDGEWTTF